MDHLDDRSGWSLQVFRPLPFELKRPQPHLYPQAHLQFEQGGSSNKRGERKSRTKTPSMLENSQNFRQSGVRLGARCRKGMIESFCACSCVHTVHAVSARVSTHVSPHLSSCMHHDDISTDVSTYTCRYTCQLCMHEYICHSWQLKKYVSSRVRM